MLRKHILPECEYVITNRPASLVKVFHLCWFEKRIQCLPRGHTQIEHKIFRNLLSHAMRDGLTPKEWQRLEEKIFIYLKEIGLCHEPPEPSPR